MVLMFSENIHTLSLGANKIPIAILHLTKKMSNIWRKNEKIFNFHISEKQIPLVKVITSRKSRKSFKNFVHSENLKQKRVE